MKAADQARSAAITRLTQMLEQVTAELRALDTSSASELAHPRQGEAQCTDEAESASADMMLTPKTLAELLKVSARTVRRMRSDGLLPEPIQFGTCERWRRSDIDRWLEQEAAKSQLSYFKLAVLGGRKKD